MSFEDHLYPYLASYERLPPAVQRGLGGAYQVLPPRVRFGSRYEGFRSLAAAVESWSGEEIERYQTAQVKAVLRRAARFSPFYARRFAEAGFRPERLASLADLERCPTITSDDLVDHIGDMAATDIPRWRRLYLTTAGSTGTPVGFYLQKGVSRPKEKAFLEAQWSRAGYDDRCAVAVIRGHVVTGRAAGPVASYDATRGWLRLSSYHLTPERLPEYLAHTRRFRPDVLHAYPSAALQLVRLMQLLGESWPVPLRCVLAGSERLTEPQRRILEAAFGCRVYTWYGHSERVVLAAEGRHSRSHYFWPTYGYAEFGPPDADGLREVIGTSFHNQAMPLIRYRTGDYVRVHDPRVDGPLEYPWPAVTAVEGRAQEFLVTATGRRISLAAFNLHDASFDGIYSVQFFQDRPGRAELRYLPRSRLGESQLATIRSVVARKLGDDFDLSLRAVDRVERTGRGKGRWLISTLDDATDDTDADPVAAG